MELGFIWMNTCQFTMNLCRAQQPVWRRMACINELLFMCPGIELGRVWMNTCQFAMNLCRAQQPVWRNTPSTIELALDYLQDPCRRVWQDLVEELKDVTLGLRRFARESTVEPAICRACAANISRQFWCSGDIHYTIHQWICTYVLYSHWNCVDQTGSIGKNIAMSNLILKAISVR